jgi:hypothetical protein
MSARSTAKITKQPRHPLTTLTRKLEKNLLAYAVAGAGLVSIALPAEAQVIYTASNMPLAQPPLYQGCAMTQVDINNDGVPDFQFTNCSIVRSASDSPHLPMIGRGSSGSSSFDLRVAPMQPSDAIIGTRLQGQYRVTAIALTLGAPVGPSAAFDSKGLDMARRAGGEQTHLTSGSWVNVQAAFLGLKFVISGETHYGWALVKFAYPGNDQIGGLPTTGHGFLTGSIYGYAYENTPDKPIVAGQTSGTSSENSYLSKVHPATNTKAAGGNAGLGLLATGSIGLKSWRRTASASPADQR